MARPSSRLGGVERGAELLVAAPGHGDFVVGVAGLQSGLDSFDLAGGEPIGAGAECVADSVERVVFAAAVAELFLLDPAPGLLHRLQAEFHHVEGVQYRGGVFELVADRVAVSRKGSRVAVADPAGERLTATAQPVGVHLSGAARYQVQQPGLRLARFSWSGPRCRSAPSVPCRVEVGEARCARRPRRCRRRRAGRGRRPARPGSA